MGIEDATFDAKVRYRAFQFMVQTGHAPKVSELATRLQVTEEETRESLASLQKGKAIVQMPISGEILMLPPWAAVPTPHTTTAKGKTYFANCTWDAFGIADSLHTEGEVVTSCPCCGEGMTVRHNLGEVLSGQGVVHFALPAKTWWDDINFT